MTATIVRLLPVDEQALLKCYVEGRDEPGDFAALYTELEVPANATPPRLDIAVAQILLHHVQGTLPQWASVSGDKVSLNRKEHKRHKDARLAFNPQLICTINWADSGPGFSWPESYHVTYLPGFDKFVITASRDGPDAWGCSDHAIGVAEAPVRPLPCGRGFVRVLRSSIKVCQGSLCPPLTPLVGLRISASSATRLMVRASSSAG
jgi:hypothetical protein